MFYVSKVALEELKLVIKLVTIFFTLQTAGGSKPHWLCIFNLTFLKWHYRGVKNLGLFIIINRLQCSHFYFNNTRWLPWSISFHVWRSPGINNLIRCFRRPCVIFFRLHLRILRVTDKMLNQISKTQSKPDEFKTLNIFILYDQQSLFKNIIKSGLPKHD